MTAPLDEVEAGAYRSHLAPKAALARLASFQVRYRMPFHFFENAEQAARQVERWAYYYVRAKLHLAESLTEALAPRDLVQSTA